MTFLAPRTIRFLAWCAGREARSVDGGAFLNNEEIWTYVLWYNVVMRSDISSTCYAKKAWNNSGFLSRIHYRE
jgi:hypothetical protein